MTLSRIALSAALALSLGACATPGVSVSIGAGKALTDAASALKAAAKAADAAALSNQIHGQTAATVSDDLKKAQAALNQASTLYQASHSANIAVQLATVTALAADIVTLVSGAHQ